MLARLVSHGARGVRGRRLGGTRAGEIRFTRPLGNPAVTLAEMIATGFARTQAACAGRDVLAVQGTTVTRSSGGRGSYLHAMIAVDAASGVVPGPLDAQFLERSEGLKASRRARSFEERQSARWLDGAQCAGRIGGAAQVTVVANREADIFDLFARRPARVDLIIRAMRDRALIGGGRLAARIASGPRPGQAALDLPARPGRAARAAALTIRFGHVSLRPPGKGNKINAVPQQVTYADLREKTPPDGTTPVHWRLLTTRKVETVADALDIAARYARRWQIEEVFRSMTRKGVDIEALAIRDEAPRNRLILARFIAACVVMQMTAERDGPRDGLSLRPLTDAFDPGDRTLLEALSHDLQGRTMRQKTPHPRAASPSPPGSVQGLAAGPATAANPAPSSSCEGGSNSRPSSTAPPWPNA